MRSEIESDIISFKNNAALVAGQSDAAMSTVDDDDKCHVVVGGHSDLGEELKIHDALGGLIVRVDDSGFHVKIPYFAPAADVSSVRQSIPSMTVPTLGAKADELAFPCGAAEA